MPAMFIPMEKVDMTKRLVYGTIGAEEVDHSGEILDYASAKAAFQKWSDDQFKASGGKSYGNVRSMHNRVAAGKIAEPLQFDDVKKTISACAYISDDTEWAKVLDGTHTGFSPGGGYAKRDKDKTNPQFTRYTPVVIELSLVDVPCQPSATFSCIKADGTTEMRKFKSSEEIGDLEQGFRSKDGKFFKAKVAAKKWNDFLDDMEKVRTDYEAALKPPALEALHKAELAVDKLEKGGNADDNTDDEDEEDDQEDAAAAKKKADDEAEKVKKAPHYSLKKAADHDLQKGFFNIARLAEIISDLHWLATDVQCEEECEGDGDTTQPSALKAAVETLIAIITMMVAEEGAELGEKMEADKTVDLPRDIADKLVKLIGAAHPMVKQIKILEPVAPVVQPTEELLKLNQTVATLTSELAEERKVTTEMTDGMTKLAKRLEVIERQPMPIRGPLRAVDRATERTPAPELKKDSTAGTDKLQMPAGLSPRDQRVWSAEQQRLNRKH